MTIELESWEAEECIEALNQSVLSLKERLKNIHPANPLGIKAIEGVIETQELLATNLQQSVWEKSNGTL